MPHEIHYDYYYYRAPARDASDVLDYGLRLPVISSRSPHPRRQERIRKLRGLLRTEARQLTQVSGTSTWVSRDERYRIRAGVRSAEVVDARAPSLLALVDRPMAEWRPGDSRTVREVPADICGLPGVRVLRLLVSAGLEYRFGTEVALGDIQADTDGSDDIALRTDSEPDS